MTSFAAAEPITGMPEIRPYRADDMDALYRICLLTGDAGKDASHLFSDPKLLGNIFAAPYAMFSSQTAFIADDVEGAGGYIVGPADTNAFNETLERKWWPPLRAQIENPAGKTQKAWSREERTRYIIHHPEVTPEKIVERYPSHLHINLLPRLQGRGLGAKLMDTWLAAVHAKGSRGAHLGVGATNERAVRFYRAYGFTELERAWYGVIWFGIALDD